MNFTEDNIPQLRYPVAIPEATTYNVTTESIAIAAIGVGVAIAAVAIGGGIAADTIASGTKKTQHGAS